MTQNENTQTPQQAGNNPAGARFADCGIKIKTDSENFSQMFEGKFSANVLKDGQIVKGKVVSVDTNFITVDVGYKSEGLIPTDEFVGIKQDGMPKVGDEIEVFLESVEDAQGMISLSKERANVARAWEEISRVSEKDEIIKGVVVGKVKGGLSVDIGVKAFLPGSQIDLRPIRNLDSLVGKTFDFKIIKFNQKRGNIVLSRRVLLEKNRERLKSETLGNLTEGQQLKGMVKNITDYGAFIDLGGIDGLLHITDMSWGRINHPSELFSIGDEVDVMVLKYDKDNERVSLGKKQLTKDPWVEATLQFPVGTRLSGKIVNLADYGAFVELADGVEGLVHISEMSWTQRVKHPSKMVSVGDVIEAIVLDIDPNNRRISLGMKQIMANPWDSLLEKYPVGTRLIGKIRNITDFGLFIGIEEGIDGLVHVSDISWTERIKNPAEKYKVGDEVECVVLSIDKAAERFSLGIKQIANDPWENIYSILTPGQSIEGEVTRVADFGLFVRVRDNLEGLVHISELTPEQGKDLKAAFKAGDRVTTEIINIDPKERTIGLSLKAYQKGQDSRELKNYLEKQGSSSSTLGDVLEAAKQKKAKTKE